jgi:hypothetical protein
VFGKVLLSTVCGVLLCMACLAGTTWAWFVVGIENAGNEIQIATVNADLTLTRDSVMLGENADGGYDLSAGDYALDIRLYNEAKCPVYMVISVNQNGTDRYYSIPFASGTTETVRQLRIVNTPAAVSFSRSWFAPDGAVAVETDTLVIDLPAPQPAEAEPQQH